MDMNDLKPATKARIDENTVRRVVFCGARAPSGDNAQPWDFSWDGRTLSLRNDPSRGAHPLNFRERASFFALGAVIENMSIAARQFGHELRVELFPNGESDALVARAAFEPLDAPRPQPLFPFIERRRTHRGAFKARPLDGEDRALLCRALNGDDAARLRLVAEPDAKRRLARAASWMDRIMFESRAMHSAIFRHFRWTARQAEQTRDGMDVRTLELPLPARLAFRLLSCWPVVRALNALGLSRLAPLSSYLNYKSASAIGLIEMPEDTPAAAVEGGRAMQRVWLTATMLGLSFQPMMGVPILIGRLKAGDSGDWTAAHRLLVREAERVMEEVLPSYPAALKVMLFRVGYAAAPSGTSLRRVPALRKTAGRAPLPSSSRE